MTLLPWQIALWKQMQELKNKNRLPAAILISGPKGIGKQAFAHHFIHSLLCLHPNPEGFHCGQCYACELLEAETHPDWMIIRPETDATTIKIDVIRDILTFAHQTSSVQSIKAILIESAHALNTYAANALLKILEEPPRNIHFFLITEYPLLLPITIRSRCFSLPISTPPVTTALKWLSKKTQQPISEKELMTALHLAHGAPFIALDYLSHDHFSTRKKLFEEWSHVLQNPSLILKTSESWSKLDLEPLLNHWLSWISDLIRFKQIDQIQTENIINIDFLTPLQQLVPLCQLEALHHFFKLLNQTVGDLKKGAHLNPQLLIESLLIEQSNIIL